LVAEVVPWMNGYKNVRGFAEQVQARLDPAIPFGTTESKREAWVFYTGRSSEVLDTQESVLEYLRRPPPRDLLIDEETLRSVRPSLPGGTTERLRGRVGDQEFHLLSRVAAP
ncbi:MAG TPA: hypothetical protein VFT43_15740, partial [Candidatus Polarisedimenticolia bacterium]|nr:hypothetical protein [Candidatus Polarisedimenticolia bacterium]